MTRRTLPVVKRLACASLAVALAASCSVHDESDWSVSLSNVGEGVTPMMLDGYAVVVVREDDTVRGFLPATPRTVVMDDQLHYCENAEVFVEYNGGSSFGLDGQKIIGPAPRDLDEVAVAVEAGEVVFDFWTITEGQPEQNNGVAPELLEPDSDWPSEFLDSPWCPEPGSTEAGGDGVVVATREGAE